MWPDLLRAALAPATGSPVALHPILECWWILLFHLPLIAAATIAARRVLRSRSGLPLLRDAFLAGCILWRLETIALHLTGRVDRISVILLHLLLLAGAAILPRPQEEPEEPRRRDRVGWSLAGAAISLAIAGGIYRITQLPDPYDSLTYHLMLPARWIERGSLELLPTPFGDIALTYTPAAVEGFFLGLMLPGGSDLLARVGQLPFLLLGALLVTQLAAGSGDAPGACGRDDRRGRLSSAIAALIFLFLPELLIQGTGSMADVAACAWFLAAFQRLEGWRLGGRRTDLVFGGLLAGMFLGSRYTSVVFTPLLLLPLLRRPGPRWRDWGILAAAALLTGAYPYLRNLILTGNPIYPLQVEIGGRVLLPGLFTHSATEASPFHVQGLEMAWRGLLLPAFGIAGLAWAGLGALAPWVARHARGRRLAATAAGMILLHFAVVPYDSNLRFLFPAWGLLSAAAAASLGARGWGFIPLGALGCAAAAQFLIALPRWVSRSLPPDAALPHDELGLAAAGIVAAGAATAWWLSRCSLPRLPGTQPRRRTASLVAAGALLLLLGAAFGAADGYRRGRALEIDRREHRYRSHARAWKLIRELPPGRRIAYAGANLPYPLRGGVARHRIMTLPLSGAPPDLPPHRALRHLRRPFAASARTVEIAPGRLEMDREAWRKALLAEEVDLLAVYPPAPGRILRGAHPPVELRWALDDPRTFEAIEIPEGGGGLMLFQVRRAAQNAPR